ncbi:MAG: GNAT family protein [Solirubrobacteraceae bacterium]
MRLVNARAPSLETERLRLRGWQACDREPYAALNADPGVREFFPEALTRAQSDAQIAVFQDHFAQHGFGMWALELREGGGLIGFTGMDLATYDAPFAPAIEIGWRLARSAWGNGYATEAARAALAFGFEELELEEIVACTTPANIRSRAVMERIGMTRDRREDFDHPEVAAGHPLCRHVLYRIAAADWRRGTEGAE